MIEVLQEFCYLGDVVGSSGDVQNSVTARIRTSWRKFSVLSQVLCGRVLSLKLKDRLYKFCIRSVMSYESECWAMKKVDTRRMQAAEMRMIRMMCGNTLRDGIPNGLLRDRTGEEDIRNHLGETRWYGHLERMDEINLVKKAREERVPGHIKRGRPKKSWVELAKGDMKKRNKWRRAAEEWSTSVNWEEDSAINAKRRRRRRRKSMSFQNHVVAVRFVEIMENIKLT